jgi:hypothetical protein
VFNNLLHYLDFDFEENFNANLVKNSEEDLAYFENS